MPVQVRLPAFRCFYVAEGFVYGCVDGGGGIAGYCRFLFHLQVFFCICKLFHQENTEEGKDKGV